MGGAGSIATCQRFLLARSVLRRGGNPPAPAFPPEGETGKGAFHFTAAAGCLFAHCFHPFYPFVIQREAPCVFPEFHQSPIRPASIRTLKWSHAPVPVGVLNLKTGAAISVPN